MVIPIFIYLFYSTFANDFFAGNGLKTETYILLHNQIIEINCTTYNDCYNLLCDFLLDPIDIITVEANQWNGNCEGLNIDDHRLLLSQYNNNNVYYTTKTVSEASILLCNLKLNKTSSKIYYSIFDC